MNVQEIYFFWRGGGGGGGEGGGAREGGCGLFSVMYICHTNQITATINNLSNCRF